MKQKEITSEVQVAKVIERYGKPVVGALVVLTVATGAYFALGAWQTHREKAVQEELFVIQKKIEKITEDLNKKNDEANKTSEEKNSAQSKDKKKTETAKKIEIVKTPETLNEHYNDTLSVLEKFVAEHKGHVAGAMGAVQAAGLAADYKDLERAKKTLEQVATEPNKGSLFFGLLRTQLGSVLMDLKQYNEAATQFQQVVDNKKQTFFHAHALLRLGSCYMETGEWDKAETAFSRIEADHANTQAAQDAKNLKRLLSLKKGAKAS
jgi:predicted negative regulator of RcsB-dependent stress response